MSMRERTTRKWVTKVLSAVAVLVALFVLVFSLFQNPSTHVYGLSKEVSTEAELKSALEAPEYDEIIVTASITLTNGTILDGDLDDDGVRKTIRALVTGTTDQGVINSNASNYTLFYIAQNATVHINNCIIKGGGNSAIVNGASDTATTNNSTLYIDKSQISNSGSASIHGGGIRNTVGGKIVLTNSSITRNVAEYGAGFQNQQGTFILDNCSVSENRSLAYGGGGGENTGNNKGNGTNAYMYIYNSTIANNTSKEIGGGINNCKNGNLYVINSTVAGNATTNGTFSGGGIGNNDSTLVCTNSILLDNVYLSSDTVEEQDTYAYSSGSVTLEGCVYGTVTGKTTALANAIEVEDSCYKASEDDSVFAATKTGSLINEDGSQGTLTYNQVALVEDENGVTYAPIASDSMAISGNSSLTPVKVEFDYSNLSNITYNTGDSCASTTQAPTTIGGGEAMKSSERIVTVTVFVNQDFQVSGGTVYGDSYIVDTEGTTDITLSATPKANKENETVVWTLVNEDSKELTIVSTENPYTLDTSLSSDIMQNSWDASKNAYDIVLQPICMSLESEAGDKSVDLSWNLSWANTHSSSYSLKNSVSSYLVYYGLVNDFNASSTTYYQETTSTNITVSGLSNETTYYFFVVPKFNNKATGDSVGYVTETPVESGVKTYVLADSIKDGESYLIVSSSNAGSAKALVGGNNTGSLQNVTVKTASGASYIEVEASDAMLWAVTKINSNYTIHSGNYYINLANTRILNTTQQNLTVAFTNSAATIGYSSGWWTYYLNITDTTPKRSTTASNVYFYKLKSKADAPTTIQASMQSTMGVDSGRITGLTTAMEYSTDGLNWNNVTGTTMENVAVGNYYFRYKETIVSYASAAVTVKVEPKCITGLSIKQSLNLNYTALDSLDLSNLIVTIIYNDDTTKDVAFNDFNSLDSSVYEREAGVITVSKTNGVTLHCSDNGTKITVDLDGFSATTLALNVSHKLTLVDTLTPTCENNGHNAYYICEDCGTIFDTNHNEATLESLSLPSIGHNYGDATYEWSSDNSKCTATLVCQNDASHKIIEEATITSNITLAPTCTNAGTMTYTATFSDSRFATQTKNVQMEALGHDYDYANGTWTWHNNYYVTLEATCKNDPTHKTTLQATITNEITKEATCLEDGIRTYTATVTVDGIDYTYTHEETIEKLGHNYSYPSYVWASDYSSCTATRVCQNDASHTIIEEATITSEITTAPTCTNPGVISYTATFTNSDFETQTKTAQIAALGHDYDYSNGIWDWQSVYYVTLTFSCTHDASHTEIHQATITNEITKDATCTTTGIRTYTATVVVDGNTYTDTFDEEIPAIGHTYGSPSFEWSSDFKTCTGTVVCQNDPTHIITETVNSTSEIYQAPTCLEEGTGLFTAEFTNSYFYTQKKYTVIPALGHDYEITYTWDGNSSVTALAICKHDNTHKVEETVNTSSERIEATCVNTGLITYSAIFENALFEEQTKEIVIEALGHTPLSPVKENEVLPTCETAGSYDLVTYCDVCGEELERETITVPAFGHTYGEVTYTWSSDNKTVTAERICSICNYEDSEISLTTSVEVAPSCLSTGKITYTAVFEGSQFETQTKEVILEALGHTSGTPVKENEVLPTCETAGSYDLVTYCDVCGEELSRETITVPALGHTYTYHEEVLPTCTTTGMKAYYTCDVCGKVFDIDKNGTTLEALVMEALGHTPLSPVKENEVLPTCETEGSYHLVTYCDVCGEELARETVTVPALGHTYGDVTYTWSSDNKQVTAERICSVCNYEESEISLTTSVTVEPSCTTNGKITYTAVFEGSQFETQTKEVILEALGHTSGTPVKENEVLPTCETTGSYDLVTYCTVCGEELSRETITVPALGHTPLSPVKENEVLPTCEETGSYDLVTYCDVCGEELARETITVPAKDHTYTYHAEVLPTCTTTGMKAYYTCDVCGKVFDIDKNGTTLEALVIETLGHTSGTPVKENEVLPTCEEAGSYDLVTYCTVCGEELSRETITVKALGHTPLSPVKENEVLPTCEEAGSYDLVTYCDVCGEQLSRETVPVPALGHTYGDITYTWSSDNMQVTAKRICSVCNYEESEISLTTSVTVEPSCTTKGKITYTAVFENPAFEIQTKEVTLDALGHLGSTTVKENEVLPTCENTGSYDLVVYCDHCGIELSRETVTVSALGHTYGEVTYTWSSDNKQVTASRTCETCGNIESEVVNTTFTTIDPVCTEAGKITYTAVFENPAFEAQTKEVLIEALGHNAEEAVKENEIPATCYLAGSYDLVIYCSVCGIELSRETIIVPALGHSYGEVTYEWSSDFETVTATRVCMHDASHVETETVTTSYKTTVQPTCMEAGIRTYTAIFSNLAFETQTMDEVIPALGHKAASSVIENRIEATCLENGSYDVVVYCSRCGEELSRETIIIPALGHTYGEVSYTWSSDNKQVTAERICSICGGIDSETVATTSVEVAPSCLASGYITYTAVFENSAFETQTKEVTLDALGHNYQNPTYTWNSDNTKVTATIFCQNDSNHIITETVNTTFERVEATCTEDGYILYTAVFENELFASQTKNIVLEAQGHTYVEVTYTWSSDNKQVTAERICSICGNIDSETVATTAVEVAPSCTASGYIRYTAVFENSVFETQTKEVILEALGHNYQNPTYTWSSDNTLVSARISCIHDDSHTIVESVKTTSEITVAPTCLNKGIRTFTATFTGEYFETQIKTIEIDALGHSFTHYDSIEPSCTSDGRMEYYYCDQCNTYFDSSYNEVEYEDLIIEALGHNYDYEHGSFLWDLDNLSATYYVYCLHDSKHVLTFDANITSEITKEATCSLAGEKTYIAKVIILGNEYTSTKKEAIPALGHEYDYTNGIWNWNTDYTSATISFLCIHDSNHLDTYNANITSSIKEEATCVDAGILVYTAKVSLNGITYQDSKEVAIPLIPHSYKHYDEVLPTCVDAGILEHYICENCGNYFDKDYNLISYSDLIAPALGHEYDYANGTFIFANDYSSATYIVSCMHDDSHKENFTAEVSSEVTSLATHTETGKISHTATVTIFGNVYTKTEIEETPRLHHTVSTKIARKEATCLEAGNIQYYYCEDCGIYYSDAQMTIEIALEDTIIPALGHTYTYHAEILPTCTTTGMKAHYTCDICGCVFDIDKNETSLDSLVIEALGHTAETPVKENEVLPTCETTGSYDLVTYCSVCGEELSRETVIVPSLGHTYTYHEEVPANCTTTGMKAYYTCDVCGKVFDVDKKETTLEALVIEALGHTLATSVRENEVLPTCETTGSYDLVTYCDVCGEELSRETITVPALGHTSGTPVKENEVLPTCETAGSYDLVTYCTVCGKELSRKTIIVPAKDHTYTYHEEVAASCLATGMKAHYTCDVCGKVFDLDKKETTLDSLVIEALGHTALAPVKENEVLPTCEKTGSYDLVTYCDVCGEEILRETVIVPALGHSYGDATYTWSSDFTSVAARRVCDICGHVEEEVSSTTNTIVSPSCITDGNIKYIATFINEAFKIQTHIEILPAIGHDYVTTYTWSSDNKQVTATAICAHDSSHRIVEVSTTTSETIKESCTMEGKITYTATFTNDTFETQVKEVSIPQAGHTLATPVKENEILPTCGDTGSYDLVTYCTICGDEISRETITVPALGHTSGTPVKENEVLPTCLDGGSYDLVTYCTVCGEEISRETILVPALGHHYIHHDSLAPTCLDTGNYEYYTCSECDKYFDLNKSEVEYEELIIDSLGHTLATPVKENEVLPTCEETGSYDLVTYCSVCGIELVREHIVVPSLGHSYKEVTYTWSSDNEQVTAERICSLCGHKDIEVSNVSSVTVDATCNSLGKITYTAEFENSAFDTQVKIVSLPKLAHSYKSIVTSPTCEAEGYTTHVCELCKDTYIDNYQPALGHSYDHGTWTWNNDYNEAFITFSCNRCDHEEVILAEIHTIYTAPTCILAGSYRYEATASFDGLTYKDIQIVTVDALGHTPLSPVKENEVLPTCEATGSYDLVTYCDVCGDEISREKVIVAALGHNYDYSNGTWTWSSDYTQATYIVSCLNDSNHTYSYNAEIESEILKEATCDDLGIKEYTASVTILGITYTNSKEEELPMLHHETTVIVPMKQPTCLDAGNILYYHCVECGKYFSDSKMTNEISLEDTILPALGHTYTYHEDVASTCTDSGIKAHYSCDTCGMLFDLDKNEIHEEDLIIEALGHSFIDEVILPTCEEKGYTTHTCSICGESYIDNYTDALGHDYQITYEWNSDNTKVIGTITCSHCDFILREEVNTTKNVKNSSCHEEGLITYRAEFINSLFEVQIKNVVIEKLMHNPADAVIENLVYSTCLEEGSYDSVIYCSICHEELSRKTIHTDKLNHNYHDEVIAPTCEEKGYTIHTCEFCGESYMDTYTDALGHHYHEEVTLPTCEMMGYTTYTCDICGDSYIGNYQDALGHDYQITYTWDGYQAVTASAICLHDGAHIVMEKVNTSSQTVLPTCEAEGFVTYKAVFANPLFVMQVKVIVLDKVAHSYSYHEEVSASCEVNGIMAHYTCDTCGTLFDLDKNVITEDDLVILALGHSYQDQVIAPTCEDKGYTIHTCSICGDSYIDTYTDALGHSYQDQVIAPTCEDKGYTIHTCSTCGDSYIDTYTDALGHKYSISYLWNSDNTLVTATAICDVCHHEIKEEAFASSTVIKEASCDLDGVMKFIATFDNSLFQSIEKEVILPALGHDIHHHDGKEPSCTEAGYMPYDTCSRCDYTTYLEIPALGHKEASFVIENEIATTCSKNGSYDKVIYCQVCGDEISRTTIIIPALGHSYSSTVTAPSCTDMGYTTHTCSICGESYVDNYTNALGHAYGDTEYIWNSDNREVTASKTCLRCASVVSETVETTFVITKNPTCTEEGILVITAAFTGFDSDEKILSIPVISHVEGDKVKENEIPATCEIEGSYDLVTYCSACGSELSRETIILPALGHTYDYSCGTWSWAQDYSSADYTSLCINDNKHKDVLHATITRVVVKDATDLETGLIRYTAEVIALGITYTSIKEEVIPTTSHEIKVVYEISPTCTTPGNITYYYCENCNKYYKDANLEIEIAKEDTILPALGHDYVSHSPLQPSCTEPGYEAYQTCTRCDYTTYHEIPALGHHFEEIVINPTCLDAGYTLHNCTNCNESYKDTYVSALGHDYQISYEWNSDYSKCTAKAVCKHNDLHVILEEVNTKSSIVTIRDCENDGLVKYTATFLNPIFDAQIKLQTLKAQGHMQGEMVMENVVMPSCTNSGSHDEVYYCSTCGSELRRISVIDDALGHSLIHHEGKAATCLESGYKPYDICSVCGYTTYEEIKPLGHTKGEVQIEVIEEATCLASGAHYEKTYCLVCGEELSSVVVIDKALGHHYQEQKVLPTCTTQGYTTHTCLYCGRSYQDTYVSALGHDYSNIEYVWSMDNTYCDAYAYCTHDHNHMIHEKSYASYELISNPTCDMDGLKVYSAIFTNILFKDQEKNVYTNALGHSYSDASYTWNEYNSIVRAERECMVCHHIDEENAHTTYEVIDASCEEDGKIIYSVVFKNNAFQNQEKEIILPKLGHSYGDVFYTWNSDYSKCIATRVCAHDESHKEMEEAVSSNVVVDATCLLDGLITYTARFENREFEAQVKRVVIPALGHDYHFHETTLPLCLVDGVDSHYTCDRCNEIFDLNHNVVSMDSLVLPMLGHDYDIPTYTWSSDHLSCIATRICKHDHNHIEEEVALSTNTRIDATCLLDGVIHYMVSFTNSAFDAQEIDVILPKLGHAYDNPTYEWSSDYTSITATRICMHDHNHIEKETVATTSKVVINPTCEDAGLMNYKAHFTNPAFGNTSIDVPLNPLGHDYSAWEVVSLPSVDSYGMIRRICKNDSNHIETKDLPMLNDIDYTYTVVDAATGAKDGLGRYTGTFEDVFIMVQVTLPALGFDYSFYKGNTILSKHHGYLGDSLIVPDDLSSYVVNGYVYSFTGWDKEIPSELDRDINFFATFVISAVIYNDIVIEIPESLPIDPSYRVVVDKDISSLAKEDMLNELTKNSDYEDFDITTLFHVDFEKDGNTIDLKDRTITIKIKEDAISDFDSDTTLFYFGPNGEVKEMNYYTEGGYVIFEMGNVGTVGFANDGYNWLWTVLIIQSFSIVLLAGVIVYRKKFRG